MASEQEQDPVKQLENFWPDKTHEIMTMEPLLGFKTLELPLARIKKIMKLDEDVKMISAEAPILFAKACDLFINELTLRAWCNTEENKRRTLQKSDIAMAITQNDQFDFLIDIVPRDELKPTPSKKQEESKDSDGGSAPMQYYIHVPQTQSTPQKQGQQLVQVIQSPAQAQHAGSSGGRRVNGQVVQIQAPASSNTPTQKQEPPQQTEQFQLTPQQLQQIRDQLQLDDNQQIIIQSAVRADSGEVMGVVEPEVDDSDHL